MEQKWIYLCENRKTKERQWLLMPCKGWKVIERWAYSFKESGLSYS